MYTGILHTCYNRQYITVRDGNACHSLNNGNYAITASGVNKSLYMCPMIEVDRNAQALDKSKSPSIETMAHIYALQNTNKSHSLHVHPVYTIALLNKFIDNDLLNASYTGGMILGANALNTDYFKHLQDYPELTRYTKVGVPVDSYNSGSDALHDALNQSFEPDVNIVPMHKHGVMTVGNSFEECLEHIERIEHVSKIILLGL